MNQSFNALFPGGGAGSAGGWARPIVASTSITAPMALIAYVRAMGGGGGGAVGAANSAAATGGNSAPWGYKKIELAAGQVLAIALGAPGAKAATTNTDGSQGGSTIISVDGTPVMTCQGGEGGRRIGVAGTVTAPTPAAVVTGAVFWVPGAKAGDATFTSTNAAASAGAAVDLLALGVGRSANVSNILGSPGGAVGADAATGGNMPYPWLAATDWGFVLADPSLGSPTVGVPGYGAQTTLRLAGPFGGGASQDTATLTVANGGFGAGGAGGKATANAGNGGQGYAYIVFVPKY